MTNDSNSNGSGGQSSSATNGNGSANNKPNQNIRKTGVYGNSSANNNNNSAHRFEANLPGMPKENVFLYGVGGQVERFLKSKRGLLDWVGASKELRSVLLFWVTFEKSSNSNYQ